MPLVRTRLALLALALTATAGAATLLVPPASAETAPVFEGGVLELLRPSGLVGDGGSAVDLYVLALGPDGAPMAGIKPKVAITGGTATEPVDAGGGLYRFTFTPAKVDAPSNATIEWKGKLPNKQAFTRVWTLPVAPPPSRALALAASPASIALGTDKNANVTFTLSGGETATLAAAKLGIAVSSGTVANLVSLGGGQFGGLYTPPSGNAAAIALVTAVDTADPTRTYGGLAIPLVAKADQAVTVPAGARVILKVGGREFGPVTADSKGRAKVPIVIPPGTTTAGRVVVGADGIAKEDTMDLAVPEARRVALFPLAKAVPADARVKVPVRALVVTPDGRPDDAAQVVFSASAGTVGPARHEGGGVYVAEWSPPSANAASTVTMTAKLADRPPVQTSTGPVGLVPLRAASVALTADPIPAAATSFTVKATAKGPDGAALAGRKLAFSANGAKLGEVKDLKNGEYAATFTPTGKGPVEVTASVTAPATGNPMTRVLLVPARERLPADGLSSAMLTVVTTDDYGSPAANVEVALSVLTGDGSLPATITTNADGVANVYYSAGRKNGFVAVQATAGTQTAGASLVQAPEGVPLPDLPTVAPATIAALTTEWAAATTTLRIERAP